MIDTDGSGAVDALELRAVFTVRITVSVYRLGLHMSPQTSAIFLCIAGTSQQLPARLLAALCQPQSSVQSPMEGRQSLHQGCAVPTMRAFCRETCMHPASSEPWLYCTV